MNLHVNSDDHPTDPPLGTAATSSGTNNDRTKGRSSLGIIVGAAAGGLVLLILVILLVVFLARRSKRRKASRGDQEAAADVQTNRASTKEQLGGSNGNNLEMDENSFFGRSIIPYSQLTLGKKIGAGEYYNLSSSLHHHVTFDMIERCIHMLMHDCHFIIHLLSLCNVS